MVFSIPSFNTVGDDYDRKEIVDERSKGKIFVAVGPKKGKNPDALFSKAFLSINEGDKFVESQVADRRHKNEKLKKNLTAEGFKYANFPPKAAGLGSYFGTIQKEPWRHETDFLVPRKGECPTRKKTNPRQIYTAPPKKGTYGFPNTVLCPIGKEYVASFYDAPREKHRQYLEQHRKFMKGMPFSTGGRRGTTFDESLATGASQCYMFTAPMAPRREKKPNKYTIVVQKVDHPFKPAGPAPTSTVMEYREDPYDGKDPREVPKKKGKGTAEGKPAWKPNKGQKDAWYTQSIAFKRL